MTPEEAGAPAVENIGLGGSGGVVIKDVGPPFELTYSQGKCQTLEEHRNLPLLFLLRLPQQYFCLDNGDI